MSEKMTFEFLCQLEPGLKYLYDKALSYHSDTSETFCAIDTWYSKGMRGRVQDLVGFKRLIPPDELRTTEAYDVAYQTIYQALPGCRNCNCIGGHLTKRDVIFDMARTWTEEFVRNHESISQEFLFEHISDGEYFEHIDFIADCLECGLKPVHFLTCLLEHQSKCSQLYRTIDIIGRLESDDWGRIASAAADKIAMCESRISHLEQQLETHEKDAIRYRWIKSHSKELNDWAVAKAGQRDLDAVIDSAMSQQ